MQPAYPALVASAEVEPFMCAATGDTVGQMVDTGRELRGLGRLYISRRYGLEIAKAIGAVKGGDRFAELNAASESLGERERQIEKLQKERAKLLDRVKEQTTLAEEHAAYREWAEGRIDQLAEALRTSGHALLELAGEAVTV